VTKDFYATLGVAKDATKEEIKKAYYKKSQKHHPDKGGKEKDFQAIALAYEVLSDEEKRGKYDRGEPIFDTQDPEAFIRSRVLSLFDQQINNPQLNHKHTDIFSTIIQNCKRLIEQAPQGEFNAREMIKKYAGIRDRIHGENTEIYVNTLNQKIKQFEEMIKQIPKQIEDLEKIIKYIEVTKYRTDERPPQRRAVFQIGANSGSMF
jgi:curved DNA-binding protein CbpA